MSAEKKVLFVNDTNSALYTKVLEKEMAPYGFTSEHTQNPKGVLSLLQSRPDINLVFLYHNPQVKEFSLDNALQIARDIRDIVPNMFLILRTTEPDQSNSYFKISKKALVNPADLDEPMMDQVIPAGSTPELTAAYANALLRKGNLHFFEPVIWKNLIAYPNSGKLIKDGEHVHLTPNETRLFQVFTRNPDQVLLSSELLSKAWGPEYRDDLEYLRRWVSSLRRKVEEDFKHPTVIKNWLSVGYIFAQGYTAPKEDTQP